jgi:CRP/FNR family transcriptional regulator, cyclic AMP receptor protein
MTTTDTAAVVQLMRDWRGFSYVPDEAHQWLAERARLKRFSAGKLVYMSGDPATYVYGVFSGVFRIYMSSHGGDQITLEEVVTGGWFPHIVPADTPRYYFNCICQQDARVAAVPMAVVLEFAERWPLFYKGLYREFGDRAGAISARIELLSLHNLKVRLAVYLLRLAKVRGRVEPGGSTWVSADDSQTEIGSRVGGTRQAVNTILNEWNKRKIIASGKDGVRILDLAYLHAEASRSGFDVQSYLAGYHGGWQGRN